jgi:hypothetical protein
MKIIEDICTETTTSRSKYPAKSKASRMKDNDRRRKTYASNKRILGKAKLKTPAKNTILDLDNSMVAVVEKVYAENGRRMIRSRLYSNGAYSHREQTTMDNFLRRNKIVSVNV